MKRHLTRARLATLASLVVATTLLTASSGDGATSQPQAQEAQQEALAAETVTVAVAGDVCGSACNQTDDVIAAMNPDKLLIPGDIAYDSGTLAEFEANYDPTWGQFNDIAAPVPGNHEYYTSGAQGYFDYFNSNGVFVGNSSGSYSFNLGSWHILALNSNADVTAGGTLETWVRSDLASSTQPCTLAYWHHPRFSSGDHGDNSKMAAIWKALTDNHADVVVSGHDHHYERFARSLADGTQNTSGVRSFVIGTGGRSLYSSTTDSAATSRSFNNNTFGVGQFELSPTGYEFDFKPVAGRTFTDSVSGTCHAKG